MIEASLTEHLKSHVSLVGNRVGPLVLPSEAQLPYLTYQRLPGTRLMSHQGLTGFTASTFQLDIWSGSQLLAKKIAEQVRTASAGFPGTMGTVRPSTVHAVLPGDDRDLYDPEYPIYHISVDWLITYKEE